MTSVTDLASSEVGTTEHGLRLRQQHHWRQVFDLVGPLRPQADVDGKRLARQQQGVAVGRGVGHDLAGEIGVGARLVLDDQRLPQLSPTLLPSRRAMTSTLPPAPNASTSRTGRVG